MCGGDESAVAGGDGDGICRCVETVIVMNGTVVDDDRRRLDRQWHLRRLLGLVGVDGGVVAAAGGGGGDDDGEETFPRPTKRGL